LERRFDDDTEAIRAWGPDVGRRYILRVGDLMDAASLQDLYAMRQLDLHPLTGDRRGQLAIRLTGQVRLIFSMDGETAVVEEVADYHG
jgi:proteic killer suppression protein